jgi:tetratricopeptide (TPR) repeat protein
MHKGLLLIIYLTFASLLSVPFNLSGQSLPDSLISSGNRKLESDDLSGALREFEIVLSMNPENNRALNGKITALYLQGNIREARRLVDRAIDNYPEFAGFYYSRGMISNQRRNYRRAIDDFNRALALQEGNQSRILLNRGVSKLNIEDQEDAMRDFELAIEHNPLNIAAYNYRGMINYRNARYNEAIEDFDRIIGIQPQNEIAYYNRGMAYLRSGHTDQACPDFHRACQLGSRSGCQMIIMECQ